jgi:putative transposase
MAATGRNLTPLGGSDVPAHPCKERQAWNEPGNAHFLTYSCVHRWPLLSKDRSRHWVIEALEYVRSRLDVALWAYVIMPEHVHVVCLPRQADYRMEHILAALKRSVSRKAKEHLAATGNQPWLERLTVTNAHRVMFRFWEPGGGYDRNICRSKSVPAAVEYVHANPVRRGLVANPLEWAWSSARFWHDGTGPIRMDLIEL